MLFKIIHLEKGWFSPYNTFGESIARPRQMFITQSMRLAEKVKEAYQEMCDTLAGVVRDSSQAVGSTTTRLLNRDEDAAQSAKYPKRYSLLEDNHFPFFSTTDQVS